jgi:hypothetical protein
MGEFADTHDRIWRDAQAADRNGKKRRRESIRQAVLAEREACAKIADAAAGPFAGVGRLLPCVEVAAAIRARKEPR